MALLCNNTVLLRPNANGSGAHPWASCNSIFRADIVCGLSLNPFPNVSMLSNEALSRGRHCRSKAWLPVSIGSLFDKRLPKAKAKAEKHEQRQRQEEEEEEDEEDYQVLTAVRSRYNDIKILDTPKSRVLLLDNSYYVHSILYKHKKWTNCYWDEFASLPPIVPKGPIGILGLAGGTAAHLMLHLWPELQLEGWEIDQILIDKARDYLGLSNLEMHTEAGGILNVHVGDALSPSINISGGYAGLVVDLASDGRILPQLEEVTTWLEMKNWLMPNGRMMVNCCGASGGSEVDPGGASSNGSLPQNSTVKALSQAFPGEICWKRMAKEKGYNYLALTGPVPDMDSWSTTVPYPLSDSVKQWKPYEEF